jgi:hypothetical protein
MKPIARSTMSLLLLVLAAYSISAGAVAYSITLSNQILPCPDSQQYDSVSSGLTTVHCPNDVVGFNNSGNALNLTAAFLDTAGSAGLISEQAFASASLPNGTVGAFGHSSNLGGLAQASAQMFDTLTFTNTNGSAVNIDVFATLHGAIVPGSYPLSPDGQGWQDVDWAFCLGNPCYISSGNTFRYLFLHNSALGPNGITITEPSSGLVSVSLTPGADPTSEIWHGVFSVPAGQSQASVFAYLATDCRFGASCDYAHTAGISLNLPRGVSFSSGSGVFLTQLPPSAAPEPATLPLIGAALLALAARRYRAHCSRCAAASRVRG